MNDNLIEVEQGNTVPSEIIEAKLTASLRNKDRTR